MMSAIFGIERSGFALDPTQRVGLSGFALDPTRCVGLSGFALSGLAYSQSASTQGVALGY